MKSSMTDSLTKKQRELRKELDEIAQTIGVDYWNILDREAEARTPVLDVMKREIIRGEVVSQYTLLDEFLNNEIAQYFFGKKRGFSKLWKTKKFERFNYFVLERLALMEKFVLVKEIKDVPRFLEDTIPQVNALRNAMAHAFFPENLRAYRAKKTIQRREVAATYKGIDIFTLAGITRFMEDMRVIHDYFVFGKHPAAARATRRPENDSRVVSGASASTGLK